MRLTSNWDWCLGLSGVWGQLQTYPCGSDRVDPYGRYPPMTFTAAPVDSTWCGVGAGGRIIGHDTKDP